MQRHAAEAVSYPAVVSWEVESQQSGRGSEGGGFPLVEVVGVVSAVLVSKRWCWN